MKIGIILDKIDANQLFVPAFQREYVWKRDDVKQLIDSLIKEYPTGTMLTWDTSSPPELKGPHKYNPTQGTVKLLLDGQQRITSLYLLIRGEIPPYYTLPEINDTRGLFVNLENLELSYYMKTRMENNPFWQNITDVFQRKIDAFLLQKQLAESGGAIGMDELQTINNNINAITQILEREFPEQIIPPKASIKESIDIFYKVNASGVALTEAELALAQISGYWADARDIFKKKLAELADQGFVFRLDFMVYAVLACMYSLGSDMRRLHGEENLEPAYDEDGTLLRPGIKDVWHVLDTKILDYVMNLLRSKGYVDHTAEIGSVYAVIPMIAFCYRKRDEAIPEEQLWRMIKWFYYSQVRRRYVSQLPQKLDFDLRIVKEADRPFEELLGVIAEERQLEIVPDEFVGRTVSHPLFGMLRWYLKSQNATCLTTGLGLHQNMGKSYQLENDHIFPASILKKHGYGRDNRLKYAMAQELTNRALLTQIANRKKSDTAAFDYLTAIKAKSPEALERQCIPTDESLWVIEHYEDFLVARRELLASRMNTYLNGLASEKEADYGAASLDEMIADGESEDLEFKSTLRWDLKLGQINKALESVIVKTVSAFANTEGGTLLIGVDDDGNALGLEHDYTTLNGDKDAFELHLRNLFHQQIGKPVTAACFKVSFPLVQSMEICQIEVTRSRDPIMLTVKDKNGVSSEKLYIRSGNSSQELSMSEFNDYSKDRF
jgi:hypothetical protein